MGWLVVTTYCLPWWISSFPLTYSKMAESPDGELRPLPPRSLETEEVVGKRRLALHKVKPVAPEPAAFVDDHAVGPGFGYVERGGDGVGGVEQEHHVGLGGVGDGPAREILTVPA